MRRKPRADRCSIQGYRSTAFERRETRRRARRRAKRRLWNGDFESLPRRHVRSSPAPDNLLTVAWSRGPLWRWMQDQQGRRWDEVWSDLCRRADRRTLVGMWLRGDAARQVEIRVYELDGVLVRLSPWGFAPLRPGDLYVCPASGVLRSFVGS